MPHLLGADRVPFSPDLQVVAVWVLRATAEAAWMVRGQVSGMVVPGEPPRPVADHRIHVVHHHCLLSDTSD